MHECLQPPVGFILGFRRFYLGREPHQSAVGPILQDCVGKKIKLRPNFASKRSAAFVEPVVNELSGTTLFDDDTIERMVGIAEGQLLNVGDGPASPRDADDRRVRGLALALEA